MSEPRLRRVEAADMAAFDEESPPELYVKWDGVGKAEKLQWVATCLFESGRRVFHMDDNGSILLVDSGGNSMLGASELYVPQEKMFVVMHRRRGEWTVWYVPDDSNVFKEKEGNAFLEYLSEEHPGIELRLAEVLI